MGYMVEYFFVQWYTLWLLFLSFSIYSSFSVLLLLLDVFLQPDLAEGEDEVINLEIVELEKKLYQQVGLHPCSS